MQTELVKEYYGQTLKTSADLKTNACCTPHEMPAYLPPLLANVHSSVKAKYYGCEFLLPSALEDTRVLDLGSGSGRDAYLLAQLVGEQGEVIGVDMTKEQLETSRAYVDWHRERFGYARSNVRFIEGYLEQLDHVGLNPASFDVLISNCVINLCVDKLAVFKGAFNLLKQGGELYFSDVYADRRAPEHVRSDPVLYGECLGGALYWNDFMAVARQAGFRDPRLVSCRSIEFNDPLLEAKLGAAKFYSVTCRLFRLDELEPDSENYGQFVTYKGGLFDQPETFSLDMNHQFKRGEAVAVSGNTWRMLKESRFARHFKFVGDFSTHHGAFTDIGAGIPQLAACTSAFPAPTTCKPSCC